MKNVAFLDFETTGVDLLNDEVIEGAILLFELTPEGRMGTKLDEFQSFNDPGRPIPPFITRLTGITDDNVRDQTLDWDRLTDICRRAELIVAHNAGFDRSWLEKQKISVPALWGCSHTMIDWKGSHFMPCAHLKHLAWEHKFFPNAHRAMDDVVTLAQLLEMSSVGNPDRTYLQEMLSHMAQKSHIVFATGAPYDSKDKLRMKKFRWSPSKRVWWKMIKENDLPDLAHFLALEVYPREPGFEVSEAVDPLETGLEERFGLK